MRQSKQRSTIPTASALLITVFIAIIAFSSGMRAEEYGVFDQSSANTESESVAREDLPEDLDYTSVEALYDVLRKRFDGELTEKDLIDGLKKGLAEASGDPYTVYLNSEETQDFNESLNGTFSGIGAEIGLENELLIVVAPLKGFPAEQAGLRSGDGIIEIDGEETFGMSIEDAVQTIRGPEGSEVELKVLRDGKPIDIKITREKITIPSVEWEIIEGNIGKIEITRFGEDTSGLLNQAADEMIANNVSGLIVDLRNNSGGYLQSSVDVSGLWIDGELVVEQREQGGTVVTESLKASRGAKLGDIPTVLLINGGSASASEIVAGALQDYKKATLIGETSYGKGSVQSLEQLNGGAVLKVTIARWFTPNGNNIDNEGISPDIEIVRTNEDYDAERDPQLEQAIKQLSR